MSASLHHFQTQQREGEFIITYPYGYHGGFNAGFNIAEATNFASKKWIESGLMSSVCDCSFDDTVQIDMEPLLNKHWDW